MNWRRDVLPPAALIVFLILAWFFVARVTGLKPFILPTPLDVIHAGWRTRALLLGAIGTTMLSTAAGMVFALITGVGIAAVIDYWPVARRALYPILVASQTVQILAIAPILVIWFGFGMMPTVLIVVLSCFFPMAVSTADGLTSSDPEHIALMRAMGANKRQIWRMVRVPSALPSFFSGLRIAITYSVVAATVGEWVGGAEGLGMYMLRSKNALATDQIFVAMLITSLLSITLFILVFVLERLALPWYFSSQRKEQWSDTGIY